MRATNLLLCLLLTATASTTLAGPAQQLAGITASGELRVGTPADYKPYTYRLGHSSDYLGLDIALAAGLARHLGVRLTMVPTSWPTLLQDWEADKFDIAVGGISITPERQQHGLFSMPYQRDGKTPIARCEYRQRFQTLAQINQPDVRLIVNPGGTNERFARSQAPRAQLTVYPDNVTIFGQLVAGKADLMLTDAMEARLQQRLHPELCAIHPEAPFDSADKAMLLPRDPALKTVVDQWLQARLASGALQADVDHWLTFPWTLEPLRQAIDERLLLAEPVARAKWNRQAAIEDLPREAQVIAAAVRQGSALGLPAQRVEAVFRAQIEASKTVQRELYARWRAEHAGRFADAPDLAADIRPRLDAITTALLAALAANRSVLDDASRRDDVALALRTLDASALSPAAARQALAPLTGRQ
ncbi:cyclohexadienyl dehydratase [Duganella sp. Leaf126]|nr:gamma subclass chorismate mutase AroQ [Duganella sp. Leaf126]KQQ33376.1 cyclohexadienyl dehydratase [Duganella sp. Leaf126]